MNAVTSILTKPSLTELATVFFKLGLFGFGGPAVHIAWMQKECVEKRQWLTPAFFLDLMGATNLIPGPNSTQMTMHVGYFCRGMVGMFVAGFAFLFPAVVLTLLLTWLYLQWGQLPQTKPIVAFLIPQILAAISMTLVQLFQKSVKNRELAWIVALVCLLLFFRVNEVLALFAGGVMGLAFFFAKKPSPKDTLSLHLLPFLFFIGTQSSQAVAKMTTLKTTVSNTQLMYFFLKVACILYGSGYVLVAYLEGDLVSRYQWLTSQQLLHAIAIGQMTPGPILTTSTTVGMILGGWSGAMVSTLAMFLPSFLFVALLHPLVPKMRKHPWLSAFLDAITASSVALMLIASAKLGVKNLAQWDSLLLFGLCFALHWRWKVSIAKLLGIGLVFGVLKISFS